MAKGNIKLTFYAENEHQTLLNENHVHILEQGFRVPCLKCCLNAALFRYIKLWKRATFYAEIKL